MRHSLFCELTRNCSGNGGMIAQISQKLIFPVKESDIANSISAFGGNANNFGLAFRLRCASDLLYLSYVKNSNHEKNEASLVSHSALKSPPENTIILSKGRNTQYVGFRNGLNSSSH